MRQGLETETVQSVKMIPVFETSTVNSSLGTVVTLPTNVTYNFTTERGTAVLRPNGSVGGNTTDGDIKMHFGSRFIPYTVLAACGLTFNMLSLMAITRIRGGRSVHHTLLMNLAVCDICGSVLLWMYYNSPYIFPLFRPSNLEHCLFIFMVLVAPFILSLCCSCLSLLTLALNQYIAICDPLFSTTKITKRKACFCILIIWTLSIVSAHIPALLMLIKTRYEQCIYFVNSMGQASLEICTYALAALIIVIVILYIRIYSEVVRYRRRTPQLNRRTRGDSEAEHNYKAFITTFLLAGMLLVFWLPFLTLNFITAHVSMDSISDFVLYMKFYFLDFMPMLNFITDPIIYGIRMREIRFAYHRMFARMFPWCIREPERVTVRGSIRFTTLDTTTV